MSFAIGSSCFIARPPSPGSSEKTDRPFPSSSISTWRSTATRPLRPRSSCKRSIARGLEQARAGIALQAYIPDSFRTQQWINDWARNRVAAGGSPVTIRIVKGANMEAERVEASIRGWPQAPYKTKLETDANYLRMLHEGMQPENLAAVRLGIASHNLFTLAYGLVLATKNNALDRVQFEMLEGMANHQRRALFELTGNMLLYAPACKQEDFTNAIGYLVRRLDENTGPDNFLRHAFNIEVGSDDWKELEQQFIAAFEAKDTVSPAPRRTQNRVGRVHESHQSSNESFVGLASLDPPSTLDASATSPTPIGPSRKTTTGRPQSSATGRSPRFTSESKSPSSSAAKKSSATAQLAIRSTHHDPAPSSPAIARPPKPTSIDAVAVAKSRSRRLASPIDRASASKSSITPPTEFSAARGDLMGAMLAEGGKTLTESDPEVSEAIDFCRFYADSAAILPRAARHLGAGPRRCRRRVAVELSTRDSLRRRRGRPRRRQHGHT